MAIGDDFSVAVNGDIRYTGTTTNYTVIEFHRWLQDLLDDASSVGDDFLDITEPNSSDRATDNIITLNSPYNINDIAAQHLYDGSIIQAGGNTIYDGIVVLAAQGMYLQIMQNGNVIAPNFWTTGLNALSAAGISHRFMIKVRDAAADIDGRRLIGMSRVTGFTYSEFKINGTARGNNVMALTYATDLNNATAAATIKGWTSITNTTEGYKLLDVNNDTTNEPYYSEWNRDTFTINQFYERAKWLSRTSTIEDSSTETATDYVVGNGTNERQAQSFQNGVVAQYLTRVKFKMKKVGAPTGNLVAELYAHAGSYGTSSEGTGSAIATSVNFDVTTLTTSYIEYELAFTTPYLMAASTDYVISATYTGGDGSNYVHLDGDSTGSHSGNQAVYASAAWTPAAAEDLQFICYASPALYGLPGELFRGVTHEIDVDTPTGTFNAVEEVTWTGGAGQMYAIDSTTAGTKMWIQLLSGVAPTDGLTITGTDSTATVDMDSTIVERTIPVPFIGASTGSALIGGYGIGVETADLSASDKLFDLTNTQRIPPNNVTFTVLGLVASEDRVLVGPATGSVLDEGQLTLNGTLSGGAVTSVVVNEAIPSDTPSTGTIRIERDSGRYTRHPYSAWSTSTFTITSHDFSTDNATTGNNTYISYIDKAAGATSEAFTVVYSSDRDLFVRVRDGGGTPIKTFETTGTLGSAGGSSTVIRTSDA